MVADAPVLRAGDAGGALRVLYYVKGFPPCETGGPAEVAHHLVREWLRDPRVRLTLVVQTDSREEEIRTSLGAGDRLTVVRLPYFPTARELTALRPVLRALRAADVVHFNEFPFRHVPLILAAKMYGVPAVFSLHGIVSREARTFFGRSYPLTLERRTGWIRIQFPGWAVRVLLMMYRWVSGAWTSIVIPSEALRRDATEVEAIDPARIVVIPHGVDVSGAPAMPPLGGVGLPRILFVGKLEEIKGPDLLFAALERLRSGGTIVEVTLVGTGSLEERLRSWASRLQPHRISFAGMRRGKELEPLYASADVVVIPSRRETLSLVALEAMAAGRPILATNVGGIPEVVEGGRNGLLVAPDPDSIASGLRELIENPRVRRAMSEANLIDARGRPWSTVAAKYLALYTSLNRRRREGGPLVPPAPGTRRRSGEAAQANR